MKMLKFNCRKDTNEPSVNNSPKNKDTRSLDFNTVGLIAITDFRICPSGRRRDMLGRCRKPMVLN